MIRAYFLAACFESSSLLAPVTTIFPEANISAVVLGSRILMITAAKRYGFFCCCFFFFFGGGGGGGGWSSHGKGK
jgi:hypothetical protein